METSFKSYSKAEEDERQEQEYRRKTGKRLIIIALSTILLITIIIAILIGIYLPTKSNKSKDTPLSPNYSANESINIICNVTLYPDSCVSSISALKSSSNDTSSDPEDLSKLSLQVALNELIRLPSLLSNLISSQAFSNVTSDPLVQGALHDCASLIEDAIDHVNESISSMYVGQREAISLSNSKINDMRTWLSTAITDQETCLDGLMEFANHTILPQEVRHSMRNSTEFISNSLAIVSNILTILDQFQIPIHRKLLQVDHDGDHDYDHVKFPRWVNSEDRRLLQEENPTPDLIVAKDNSGDFRTIREAVSNIPKRNMSRFVIYVKKGVYVENVNVTKDYWNVMMYGDGMNETIISGSLNVVDGKSTFSSGTFIVFGRAFIARDMGFWNTAGPKKLQAVAMISSSDQSVFYRCSFDAYQDTLCTFSNRQFYLDCKITGTIDFIFGNAAVVFQNCSIQPRQPMSNQFNTITAQSKTDPNQNTGISIQRCQINPFENLTVPTYLGRPWKDYATTVIMESYIGGFVDPKGWSQWKPDVDPPSTIFYAEYQNIGPGSGVNRRVKWPGVRPNITREQATKYTVESFIQGSRWLHEANVTYDGSL